MDTHETEEEWRPVLDARGAESKYQVSSLGRVRSMHPQHAGKILKGGEGPDGTVLKRRSVWLMDVWKVYTGLHYVDQLVASAFLDAPQEGARLVWLNGRKWDNRPGNLAWERPSSPLPRPRTPEDNIADLEAEYHAAREALQRAQERVQRVLGALEYAKGFRAAQKGASGDQEGTEGSQGAE